MTEEEYIALSQRSYHAYDDEHYDENFPFSIENENVKNRIIIIENSDIFTMENVKLKVLEPIK